MPQHGFFHQRNGLFFRRNADNSVTIRKMVSDSNTETEVLFEQTIPDTEWASVIASVSEGGEMDGRYYKALEWHNA